MEVFDKLPIAALVAKRYLAVHGGISPNLNYLEEINQIDRFQEVPKEGIHCDLLWADPMEDTDAIDGEFSKNKARDCANLFGFKPVNDLLNKNNIISVLRGH